MTDERRGLRAVLQDRAEAIQHELELLKLGGIPESEINGDKRNEELAVLRRMIDEETKLKRVIVFGTFHDVQEKGHPKNPELAERLSFLIEEFAATTLMEEWSDRKKPSFVAGYANEAVKYRNVGTPSDGEFRTLRCPPVNHPAHDGTLGYQEDAPTMNEYGPLANQESRERWMVENIEREMGDHKVGIFIVGYAHVHSICLKLKDRGFNVKAYGWLG